MITLKFRGIAKRYNERQVFAGLSGSVLAGRVLVVTGPNGSGKSTLLRVLSGLSRPSAGDVSVEDERGDRPPGQSREDIGFVGPELALYSELTARENLAFLARLRGLDAGAAAMAALLARVGLGGREDDRVAAYSSGMRQRLKYAQAIMHRPRLLFLDEPMANLDQGGAGMVADLLGEQRERGLVVLATNEPEEVRFGDQVLRLGA